MIFFYNLTTKLGLRKKALYRIKEYDRHDLPY